MSVLACDRSQCENVMCDIIILNMYICDECWQELLKYKTTWPTEMTKLEVNRLVEAFMSSSPGAFMNIQNDEIENYFNSLVSER